MRGLPPYEIEAWGGLRRDGPGPLGKRVWRSGIAPKMSFQPELSAQLPFAHPSLLRRAPRRSIDETRNPSQFCLIRVFGRCEKQSSPAHGSESAQTTYSLRHNILRVLP